MKETVIYTENLSRKFGDFVAVNAINLDVKAGEIFGFLGANGAGKTTAMRILCGLLMPSSGKASVAGFDVYSQNELIKQHIGYMSQKFSLYDNLTLTENVQFFAGIYGLQKSEIKLKTAEMVERLGLQNETKKLVGSMPVGWKQKISFSLAIIHSPKVVFLDEPTGGVDPITRRQFWELIYETAAKGITVFATTHYMDEAEYCDRVSIMVDGSIAALDTPKNLISIFDKENMGEVFLQLARNATRGE